MSASTSSAPPATVEKPINDVVAGAMARAASQGTIHPLDTLKVQMQVGKQTRQACEPSSLLPQCSALSTYFNYRQTCHDLHVKQNFVLHMSCCSTSKDSLAGTRTSAGS